MKAVRYAVIALLITFLLVAVVAVAKAFIPPASDEYMQDTYYVVFSARTLVFGLVLPAAVLVAVLTATFARRHTSVAGLWLALTGAVMMTAPAIFYYLKNDLGEQGMPRRFTELASREAWFSHAMAMAYWIGVAGLTVVVIGAVLWLRGCWRAGRNA